MARDHGTEQVLAEQLDDVPGISSKAIFGGWCSLVRGRLVSGARHDGLLIRLSEAHAVAALCHDGVAPMMFGRRRMSGWVRVGADAFSDDAFLQGLIDRALAFVAALPDKEKIVTSSRKRQAGRPKSLRGRQRPLPDPKA